MPCHHCSVVGFQPTSWASSLRSRPRPQSLPQWNWEHCGATAGPLRTVNFNWVSNIVASCDTSWIAAAFKSNPGDGGCWAQIQIYPDQIRRFKTILTLDRSWRWREIAAHNPLEQTRRASSCCIVSAHIEGNKDKIDLECHVVLDMFGWCNDDCRLA